MPDGNSYKDYIIPMISYILMNSYILHYYITILISIAMLIPMCFIVMMINDDIYYVMSLYIYTLLLLIIIMLYIYTIIS